jgi:hypothetical protein
LIVDVTLPTQKFAQPPRIRLSVIAMNARRAGANRAIDAANRPLGDNIGRANGSRTNGDASYWSAAAITIGPIAVCSAGLFTMCFLVD